MKSSKRLIASFFSSLFLFGPLSLSSSALESKKPSLFNQSELKDSIEFIDLNTEIAKKKKKKKKKPAPKLTNLQIVEKSIRLPSNYKVKKITREENKFKVIIEKLN